MKIEINGQPLDFSLENEKTTGDILNALEAEFEKNSCTIIGIELNGKNVAADEIDTLSTRAIQDDDDLSVTSVSSMGVIDSLKQLGEDFSRQCPDLEELPVLLQQNDEKKSYDIITKFAESFDVLCHLVSLSSLFPETFADKSIDGMSLSDFLKDFSPILKDFEDSLNNKDTVLTGDLAEYEIKPRLEAFATAAASF